MTSPVCVITVAAAAGIAVQRAAERAGNSHQGFEPGQPLADGAGNQMPQLDAGTGPHAVALDLDFGKGGISQPNHQPRHSRFEHQQV
jgi:hypothetical protein